MLASVFCAQSAVFVRGAVAVRVSLLVASSAVLLRVEPELAQPMIGLRFAAWSRSRKCVSAEIIWKEGKGGSTMSCVLQGVRGGGAWGVWLGRQPRSRRRG